MDYTTGIWKVKAVYSFIHAGSYAYSPNKQDLHKVMYVAHEWIKFSILTWWQGTELLCYKSVATAVAHDLLYSYGPHMLPASEL